MSQMPQLRDILNDTPANAVDVDYNFGALETHVAQELVNRDGTVAMTGALTLAGPAPSQPAHAVPKSYVDAQVVPTGVIWQFGGAAAPAGWAVCDGGEKSSTDPLYTALFAVIGYTYGRGAGNNFLMPDMRGRVVAGVNAADAGLFALGKAGGNKHQTIILPHQHNTPGAAIAIGNHNHYAAHHHGMSHQHSVPFRKGYDITGANNTGSTNAIFTSPPNQNGAVIFPNSRPTAIWTGEAEGGPDQISGFSPSITDWDDMEGNTHNTGFNGAHTVNVPGGATSGGPNGDGTNANLPPYVTVNYIIKL